MNTFYKYQSKKIVWLMLCVALINYCTYAQHLNFFPVEGREQLNEEQIRHLIQLKDGRLGVFTEGMLNLYDGSGFTTIHIDDENTIPLNNYTGFHHSYLEGSRLWFKNGNKLAIVNLAKEVTEIHPEALLKQLGFNENPTDIYIDSKEDIWLLAKNNTLYYRQNNSRPVVFLKNIRVQENPNDKLYDVIRVENKIYLFYKSGLLRCFDHSSAKELYSTFITTEKTDNFSNWLHVTPVKQYLYIVRGGYFKGQLVRYDMLTQTSATLIQADDYWLNCFASDKNGDFYMSCKKGLWYFKSGSKKGKLINTFDVKGASPLQTEISTTCFDNLGGFWIGTFNKGLYYNHPDRFRFQTIDKKYLGNSASQELQVSCFEMINDREVLIGTNNGLYKAALTNLANPHVILKDIVCNHIKKDKHGVVWVATPKGLYSLQQNERLEIVLPHSANYIFEGDNNQLYICTLLKGIIKLDYNAKNVVSAGTGANIPNVKQIIEWNNRLIGLSAQEPFILNKADNSVCYPLKAGNKRPDMFKYTNHKYTCLFNDSANDVWLGTYDGLTLWSAKEGKLYTLHTTEGLVNNSIKAIAEDKDHSFWVTTSMGISHITKHITDTGYRFTIENFNQYNGVLDHAFVERSIFISSHGTLFTGGLDGMNILSDENKKNGFALTPVLLNLSVLVNNTIDQPNTVSITYKQDITLDYNQNFFSIAFSGLNYSNPSQTYYRFKLEGVDEDWRITKVALGNGEASYTGIAPGSYMFTVQASPDGINWSGEARSILITITPPFWKTGYAYAFYYIGGFLLITFVSVKINRAIRRYRKKQQEEAVERAKTDFITNLSHELRTPLTLIITPLRALIDKVNDQKIKDELLQIDNNSQLMLDTVNQLLDFKKMDSGHETLHKNFYENLVFIQELCNQYSQLAAEKSIHFEADITNEELAIFIDRQKVTRIVGNLLSNAVKFTPPGGTISIRAEVNKVNSELCIAVKDTGFGIDEGELENIFDRFYQAKNQNNTAVGSGIGLYMVKHYVELHDGLITVSSAPGEGTTFNVILSVKDELPAVKTNEGNEPQKTLLIAEDNLAFREYLTTELKNTYHIISAETGKQAFERAIKFVPDLIITDVMMPEMTGAGFCRALRNEVSISHIPVVMLTGRTSDEARYEGYEAGADAYLIKPFDINILKIRIEKLLARSESRKAAFVAEKAIETETLTTNPLDKKLLDAALKHVNNNIRNPDYSVEKFSADMYMDRTGLYRKLIALTGLSPTAFVRAIRLKKAAEMLTSSNTPVSEIAEESGFSSVSYFTKCFHEAYRKTPSQYRTEKIS